MKLLVAPESTRAKADRGSDESFWKRVMGITIGSDDCWVVDDKEVLESVMIAERLSGGSDGRRESVGQPSFLGPIM